MYKARGLISFFARAHLSIGFEYFLAILAHFLTRHLRRRRRPDAYPLAPAPHRPTPAFDIDMGYERSKHHDFREYNILEVRPVARRSQVAPLFALGCRCGGSGYHSPHSSKTFGIEAGQDHTF